MGDTDLEMQKNHVSYDTFLHSISLLGHYFYSRTFSWPLIAVPRRDIMSPDTPCNGLFVIATLKFNYIVFDGRIIPIFVRILRIYYFFQNMGINLEALDDSLVINSKISYVIQSYQH